MSQFSVIIPTYQRPGELRRCLECLAPGAQSLSFDQYEVVVTDDGGQGSKTKKLIENEFPWAKWIYGPGEGPAANRNRGASHAQGKWLVFTDDDCIPQEGWLKAFAEQANENPNAVLEGKTIASGSKPGLGWDSPINLSGGKLWSCNFAITRKDFRALEGFDELYPTAAVEDVDFRKRVLMSGREIYFVEDALVAHPWKPKDSLIEKLVKVRSWNRYFDKYPDELSEYNAKYFIGSISPFFEEVGKFVFNKSCTRNVYSSIASLYKSFIILKKIVKKYLTNKNYDTK